MSWVAHDFLTKAYEQGFPGALPETITKQERFGSRMIKVASGVVYYTSKHFDPIASALSSHPSGARISSDGNWIFQQNVQHSGNRDYALYHTSRRIGTELSIYDQTNGRIGMDNGTPSRFMNVLAQIAIDNRIEL